MIIAYITAPDEKEAEKMGQMLVKERLAACANYFPIKSFFMWQGAYETEKEYVILAKTTEKRFDQIKKRVIEAHDYELPCIIKIPVEANEEYAKWVEERTV